MKLKLTIEYKGTDFSGWQVQPNAVTVQGELERALYTYLLAEAKRQDVTDVPTRVETMGSGRTDAGVHAKCQVVSFNWPDDIEVDVGIFRKALSGMTPADLRVTDVRVVSGEFDARRTPHHKCYSYRLSTHRGEQGLMRDFEWAVGPLNISAMIESANCLQGWHDFAGFRSSKCTARSTRRCLLLSELVQPEPGVLLYLVQGNGFLKNMVRVIVGTLVEIGRGERSVAAITEILEAGDRMLAGETAPARGLTLEWVRYLSDNEAY